MALVTQQLMLFDTSILYCYEASLPHQVQKPALFAFFHAVGRDGKATSVAAEVGQWGGGASFRLSKHPAVGTSPFCIT